ncbi:unnamed protein product [Sphenostylis stenocarpa]|uniref:Uncharacterized protein n=1 Tax=Sphenostylis stenocarpa TaxID=92480 RepID=A0AA86W697_9FABA|nr:unnamed protein product [Sphenostylis stenocarpa]
MTRTPRCTCEIAAVRVAVQPQFSTADLCQTSFRTHVFSGFEASPKGVKENLLGVATLPMTATIDLRLPFVVEIFAFVYVV